MKISRFYQAESLSVDQIIDLSPANHRHAIQVLRLKIGASLILFNGEGGEYLATLTEADKRKSKVSLQSFDETNRESQLQSTLILAVIKPEKMDFAIQKAVELGVTAIQPMYTKRSVIKIKQNRLDKKMKHWQGVITAACEQSGRTAIPLLKEPLTIQQCLDNYSSTFCVSMLPGEHQKLKELNEMNDDQELSLLIGPEGGFTVDEEELMLTKSITPISFGSRILRAETAVIAGLTACQQCWGDL